MKFWANESLKPTKLKRHLDTKHDSYSNRPVTFFQRILRTSEEQRRSFESEFLTQEKYTRASFEGSWLIAKTKKPFNIGEDLVLRAAVRITEIVRGKKEADDMRKIPLSKNTVSRRISAISVSNLFLELKKVLSFPFSLTNQLILPIWQICWYMSDIFTIMKSTKTYYFANK